MGDARRSGVSGRQWAEYLHEVLWFFRTWALPVRLEDDVPARWLPSRHCIRRQGAAASGPGARPHILSWNIYRAHYARRVRKSLLQLLPEYDILLLQEVPVLPGGAFWQIPELASHDLVFAPYHQVRRRSSLYPYLATGQAILSRQPMLAARAFDLPTVTRYTPGRDHIVKRLVVYARFQLEAGRTLGVYNVHLEYVCGPRGRAAQVESMLQIAAGQDDDVVLLGGDFNALLGDRRESWLASLAEAGFREEFAHEPAWLPRPDRLLVRGARLPARFLPGRGSDHRPLGGRLSRDGSGAA